MAPVFLCIVAAHYLMPYIGRSTQLFLIVLGFLAGGRNGWLLVKRMNSIEQEENGEGGTDEEDDDEDNDEW